MSKTAGTSTLTVPVWIDDVKKVRDFQMTRLSYFVAEADEPVADWSLMLGRAGIPVIVSGLTAAICQPSGSKKRFESAGDLDRLFDQIEDKCKLSIETPDLWLPNKMLDGKHSPERGDVYRIGQNLFTAALRFRAGRTTEQEFQKECSVAGKATYSRRETEVFAEWSEMQVDTAKKAYEAQKASGRYMSYSGGS